eukprot:CAMPEP_0178420032 /NCGR_PEP_ID=MMETSP0689_2-20121128/25920_1 /TAXON_ID=160604 /ORGANISM="Amphidinium massartii, Strain CS-259" /LENGTH=45 /DNA_ID= /DNA_START= /DNA_END= /DNA_ORIENTATION=
MVLTISAHGDDAKHLLSSSAIARCNASTAGAVLICLARHVSVDSG